MRLSELCVGTVITLALSTGVAAAQAALDEDTQPAEPAAEPAAPAADAGDGVEDPARAISYGVALRLRSVFAPAGMVELFVERAAGGVSNFGYGIEFIRRRGDVEIQFGIEHEKITPAAGVWIAKGDNVAAGDEADYILDPDDAPDALGWYTFEFTFLNHSEINKHVSFRYGGGAGLGVISGGLYRYNVICNGATNSSPEPGCVPVTKGGTGLLSTPSYEKYDLPPVFPVVNAIIGVQIKPVDKLVINIEGGIRTFPFFGISTGYFF